MLYRNFLYLFILLNLSVFLTSCLGGGGSSNGSESTTIAPEVTDDRVAIVNLLVTDDFQRANGESLIILTVIARDRTNTPLSAVAVNLTSNSDYAVIIDPIGATEANGRFTTAIVSSVAETVAVTATAGGIRGEPVNVTFIAPVDLIELSASETVLSTNENTTVTVKLNEENTSKPLPNTPIEVTVSGSATLSTVPSTTDNNGQAQFTVTNAIAETVTITVTSGQISQTLKLYFGATLTLIPESINALDNVTLTALLKDNAQTPIAGQEIAFRFVNENKVTLTPLIATTGDNGTATVTVTDLANEGGTAIVQVNSGSLIAQSTVTFGELLVDPRVATVDIVVSNNFQAANGRDQITVTVIARDVVKAPLSDVPVSLVSTSDFALFQALNGTTGENGRFTTTITSTVAETFEVIATAGGTQQKAELTFAAPVGEIVSRASSQILPIGETSTITITILRKIELEEILAEFSQFFDSITLSGNVLDELLQQDILLPNTAFKVNAGNATLNDVPEKTNENGQASFTVTHDQAENIMLTVTSGSVTRTLPLYFGATLNLLPKTINALETATFNALLKDGNHAPIIDQNVTFNFVSENDETLTPITAITSADGTAAVTVTDLEKNGGTAKINVSSGTLNAQATVNFLIIFGENRQLEVTTNATVLTLEQSATITARINDNNGFSILGQSVLFSVLKTDGQPSNAQLSLDSGISNEQGEVITTVSNLVGENVIITVQADTAKQEIPLYFGASIKLSPTDIEGISDGITPVALTAIVSDAQNIGIAGIPVDFRVTNGQALVDKFRAISDELGRAIVNVTSNVVEQTQVEVQAESLTPTATASISFNPSQPSNLALSTNADLLSLNGETIITAIVTDNQDNVVKKNTPVTFLTDIGNITETVLTDNTGQAQATFSATTQAGLATITATAGTATNTLTLTVQPGSAGTIEVSNIEPQVIGIMGSSVVQTATIEFLVKDSLGNSVADGTPVNFSLGETTLGGGETISTEGGSGTTAIGTTNNGIVSITLKSGRVAGNIDVIATVNNTISTVARVTIVGGMPDADHLSLAVEYNNIAGGVLFGLRNNITAYVGDRFGNVVPDGTAVSFMTEGGTIGTSIQAGAFTTPVEFGQATAILQSSAPSTPNLGGVPTNKFPINSYECSGSYLPIENPSPGTFICSNPGLVTIVAYTTGSENFADQNGNGIYDSGEPFKDLSEPYIDGNDNFIFDEGELYIDVNGNGQFNQPDGQFQENTTIWTSTRVLFSAETKFIEVNPTSFQIPNGGIQSFTITNISDIYGNALVKDTRFQVTTNNGKLGGTTNLTIGDSSGLGNSLVNFTLASNPCSTVTNDDGSTTRECPQPDSATITITITSPLQDNAPGGNRDVELVIFGSINN